MTKEERRSLIIDKARELFAKFGLKKTTMNDIASACGIAKASLYYYFGGKEEIFRAVMEREFEIFKERMRKVLSKADDPREKLRAFFLTRFTHLKELADFYETLTSEYLELYPFVERERKGLTNWEIETVQSILDEGVRRGIFEIPDPKLTAVILVFALKGLETWTVERDLAEIERTIDLMLPVLFRGIERR